MPFRRKFFLLTIGSLIIFAALCFLQYRLLRNTYRLEKAAFLRELDEALASKAQQATDTLNRRAMQLLISDVKLALGKGFRPNTGNLQSSFDHNFKAERAALNKSLQQDSLLSGTCYTLTYDRVILYSGKEADSLLSYKATPLRLTSACFADGSKAFQTGQSQQQVGFPVTGPSGKARFYRLAVWTSGRIIAPNWQAAIYHRMLFTLAATAALILAVLTLFLAAFTAILRQKKIADITTDFANNMTHELRTPLSAAGIVVKSLRTTEAKQDAQWTTELLNQLDKQLERLQRLLDSVFSSLEQPTETLQWQPLSMVVLFSDLSDMAARSGRDLSINGNPDRTILTNADLLTGILINLLDNAIKYTSGDISVSIVETNKNMEISISDQGPAIPYTYRPYLFNKFFRVPQPDAHNVKGLGLGLYICRRNARRLGGDMSYRELPEGGNQFIIHLPYEEIRTAR
ncbi:sensor histidine kinase [Mucilaginibacter litoreus]|uniref:histidine kinase n=1 Tax=Mucilaginibacter litoreus TaxID=1048221 RepID=A0ABW3AUH2_9SPHI